MMSESLPRYTSTAEGWRTAEEIAALRPVKERPKRERGKSVLREVTAGIVCFCGERFGEAQALEFMLHLRAEVGEDLAVLNRQREQRRTWMASERGRAVRRSANREFVARRRTLAQTNPELIPHGTRAGYADWGCKCDVCATARREYNRKYAAKAAERKRNVRAEVKANKVAS